MDTGARLMYVDSVCDDVDRKTARCNDCWKEERAAWGEVFLIDWLLKGCAFFVATVGFRSIRGGLFGTDVFRR